MAERLRRRLAACLLSLATALGAGAARAAIAVDDDQGQRLVFDAPPARLVSLVPSLTEAVCALDACGRLVGVDRHSNSPPEVARLPRLGGLEDTQVERVVALQADLVLAAPSSRVIDRLRALGQRVMVLETRDHRDVQRTLALLGRLLEREARADALWRSIDGQITEAAARVPATMRGRRVYFEVASAPYAAGPSSFIGETLARLGLGNVVPPALGPFPKLNPEFVVRADPDLIVAADRNLAEMRSRPGWGAMRALRERQLCGFDAARYDVLVRPGPRLGEAAMLLAGCLERLATPAGP